MPKLAEKEVINNLINGAKISDAMFYRLALKYIAVLLSLQFLIEQAWAQKGDDPEVMNMTDTQTCKKPSGKRNGKKSAKKRTSNCRSGSRATTTTTTTLPIAEEDDDVVYEYNNLAEANGERKTGLLHCGHEDHFVASWQDRRLDALARMINSRLSYDSWEQGGHEMPSATAVSMTKFGDDRFVILVATKNDLTRAIIAKTINNIILEADELFKSNNIEKYLAYWSKRLDEEIHKDSSMNLFDYIQLRDRIDIAKFAKLLNQFEGNMRFDSTMEMAIRKLQPVVLSNKQHLHPELVIAEYLFKNRFKRTKCAYIGSHLRNCLVCHSLINGVHTEIIGYNDMKACVHTRSHNSFTYPGTVLPQLCLEFNNTSVKKLSDKIHDQSSEKPARGNWFASQMELSSSEGEDVEETN